MNLLTTTAEFWRLMIMEDVAVEDIVVVGGGGVTQQQQEGV